METDTTSYKNQQDGYELTSDQLQAMRELEIRDGSEWTEEDDDKFMQYLMTDAPEYDVKDRLAQVNAEWAQEPDPEEQPRRQRSVLFNENVVSEVIPPDDNDYDYDDDDNEVEEEKQEEEQEEEEQQEEAIPEPYNEIQKEEDNQVSSMGDNHSNEQPITNGHENNENNENDDNDSLVEEDFESEKHGTDHTSSGSATSTNKEDTILVERGGKFEMVQKSEYEAEYGFNDDSEEENRSSKRPEESRKSESRQSDSSTISFGSNYTSPYGLTKEEKDKLEERKRKREEQRQKRAERQKDEERNKREENDSAFQVWLRRKRETSAKERRQQENQQKKQEEEHEEREKKRKEECPSFKEWKAEKKQAQRKEIQLRLYEENEKQETEKQFVHSEKQCHAAFRAWLKRKNKEEKEAQRAEKQRARLTRLALRRSRKSQALAQALQQANAYGYVDYYGYR